MHRSDRSLLLKDASSTLISFSRGSSPVSDVNEAHPTLRPQLQHMVTQNLPLRRVLLLCGHLRT